MPAVLAIASSIVADAMRRKIVYVVALFAALMAAAIPALPSYGVGVIEGVFREVALALTWVASLVVVLALSANRIPGECEKRTVYNVLAKPVHRWQYVVGTWLGVMAVMAGVIAAFTLVDQVVGYVAYKEVMWQLWQGSLAVWMEMGIIAALAIAVSTVGGSVLVVVAAIAVLFIGHSRSALFADTSSLAAKLYPSLDAFNIINPVAHGSGVAPAYLGTMALVFVGYSAVLLTLGAAAFSRRDL